MISLDIVLLSLALVFGLYMAWNIGANDVANAMGTSVGSGALTLRQAVIAAAILEFAGAFLVGAHVTNTVRKGLFNPEIFSQDLYSLVYGMLAALLAAGAWLQIATFFGWPVSTTHSIVGAVVGFVLILQGYDAISWMKVGNVVASWVVSPLMSGVISYTIFSIIRKKIFFANDPFQATKRAVPYLVFSVFFVLTFVFVFKGLANLNLDLELSQALLISSLVGLCASGVGKVLVDKYYWRHQNDTSAPQGLDLGEDVPDTAEFEKVPEILEYISDDSNGDLKRRISSIEKELSRLISEIKSGIYSKISPERQVESCQHTEKIFGNLQILSACFVAFSHGANDVANAIGPLAAVVDILLTKSVSMEVAVPMWILALGGVGIVIGLATWGYKVIFTIGEKITELTPTRGFAAEFGAAITIALASRLGLPISTTHTLVGAVLGVGFARGVRSINLKVLKDIVASWFITLPASAALAIIFMHILRFAFRS